MCVKWCVFGRYYDRSGPPKVTNSDAKRKCICDFVLMNNISLNLVVLIIVSAIFFRTAKCKNCCFHTPCSFQVIMQTDALTNASCKCSI